MELGQSDKDEEPGNRKGQGITLRLCRTYRKLHKTALFDDLTPGLDEEAEKRRKEEAKKEKERMLPAPRRSPLTAVSGSWFTKGGWAPRHVFDYKARKKALPCRYCKKRSQFLVDVYNMVTTDDALVCRVCCVKEFSPSSGLLLNCLDYLSNEGLYGILVSKTYKEDYEPNSELVFELESSSYLRRLVDVFRWFFTFHPFEASGKVVLVTVTPLYMPRVHIRLKGRYHLELVAGSWAPRFHSGVTLFLKSLVTKPFPVKQKKVPTARKR